jgi:integrase
MALTPIQRFYSGISEETSKPTYTLYLDKFFKWAQISYENFAEYDRKDQESRLEEYIFHLRGITEKTGKYQNSYNTIIAPLKLFCTMNDIAINWDRLYKMFPKTRRLSNQGAYDDEDIKLFLDHCDNLRDISFIHFMASTAVRIGEVYLLNIGDVEQFKNGAIVTYYAGQKQEYKVCLTPEAYDYLKKYLETRLKTRKDDPLFATKAGIRERRLAKSTVSELMKGLRNKIYPNDEKNGKRKHKAPNNAYRKRLENIFADSDVQFRYASYLLDHNKSKQDPHYFRDITNERLWNQFKKAIPLITLDKSEQIIVQKDDEIQKLKESYEGEFKEKLEFLEDQLASEIFVRYDSQSDSKEELLQDLDEEEIKKYNWAVERIGHPEWKLELTKSKKMLKDVTHKKFMKKIIESMKKKNFPKEEIKLWEKMEGFYHN